MASVVGVGVGLAGVVVLWLQFAAPDRDLQIESFSTPATAALVQPPAELGRWPAEERVPILAQPIIRTLVETPLERSTGTVTETSVVPLPDEPVEVEVAPAVTAALTVSAPSPVEVNRLRNRLVMAIDAQDDQMVETTLLALRDKLGEQSVFYQRLQAFTWLRSQQWLEAEQAYDALLLQHGDDADARFNSGRLALRRGDLDKAEQRLRPLQRHPDYRQDVASMLAELDRYQRHTQAVR